jgi:hypothetical protein
LSLFGSRHNDEDLGLPFLEGELVQGVGHEAAVAFTRLLEVSLLEDAVVPAKDLGDLYTVNKLVTEAILGDWIPVGLICTSFHLDASYGLSLIPGHFAEGQQFTRLFVNQLVW